MESKQSSRVIWLATGLKVYKAGHGHEASRVVEYEVGCTCEWLGKEPFLCRTRPSEETSTRNKFILSDRWPVLYPPEQAIQLSVLVTYLCQFLPPNGQLGRTCTWSKNSFLDQLDRSISLYNWLNVIALPARAVGTSLSASIPTV